jgi:hypothetical protein
MKRIISLLIITFWAASYGYGQQAKTLNIAIIADKTSDLYKSPLIPLLETQLSDNKNIKLLERAQIDKIMQEQQLSAAGLVERNNAIKIGKLLRADAFIIITPENQTGQAGDLIRVRAAEAAHGLRLLDYFEQIDALKPDDTAERISKKIESVIGKLTLPAGAAIPVGIVDIHRVQLGDKYRILERSLPVLLSVRLGLEPKIIMLEREDLKVLQDEKLRTAGEDSKFWGSAVLIEGNLQPKNGSLEMTLSLRKSDDKDIKTITILVEPNEPSVAIDKVAADIVQAILNAPPASQWDLAAEAEQYYQQGQMFYNHQRYEEALPLFETAHALQPQNVYYSEALFERIWEMRREIRLFSNKDNPVCPYSDMEIVELVSILVHQIHDEFEKGQLSASDVSNYRWSWCLGYGDFMRMGGYFMSSVSVATKQIKLINRENRRIWIDTMSEALKNTPTIRAYLACISSDDPNELISNIKNSYAELIMPPKLGGKIQSDSVRNSICIELFHIGVPFNNMFNANNLERTHLNKVSEKFVKLWREYLEYLTRIDDPVVSEIGKLTLVQAYIKPLDEKQIELTESAGYKIIKNILNEFNNFDGDKSNQNRQQLLTRIKKSIISVGQDISFNEEIAIWEEMCSMLIEQKDVDSLAFLNPGQNPFTGFSEVRLQSTEEKEKLYLRYYLLLDRIAKIFQIRKSDSRRIDAALNNIRDFQAGIRHRYPQLNIPRMKSSISVTILLSKNDLYQDIEGSIPQIGLGSPFGARRFKLIKTQDNIIWIPLASNKWRRYTNKQGNESWPVNVGLAGIDLQQKKIIALWQADISFNIHLSEITDLVISSKACYLSLYKAGIIEFPGSLIKGRENFIDIDTELSGLSQEVINSIRGKENKEQKSFKKPKVYTEEDGLPSLSITSIAQNGNKLWVAYGDTDQESGLGLYDPKTGKWETIFCSTLKDKSPFSLGQPYWLNSLISTNPDKLFFMSSWIEQTGLWKMDTNNRTLKYFGPLGAGGFMGSTSVDTINGLENKILIQSPLHLIDIDPNTEKMKLIYGNLGVPTKDFSDNNITLPDSAEYPLNTNLLRGISFGSFASNGSLDLTSGVIYHNTLWARLGMNQIIIIEIGKGFKDAQIIDNNILDGEPVKRFMSTPYGLIAIGEGTVGLIESEK